MRANVIFGKDTEKYIGENKNKLSDHFIIKGDQSYGTLFDKFKHNGEANRSFGVGNTLFDQFTEGNITLAELCALLQIFNADVSVRHGQFRIVELDEFIKFGTDLGLEITEIEDMNE